MTDQLDPCLVGLVESAGSSKSPFDRMIVLGWFDGPTKGILLCQEHDTAYVFRTLARDPGKYDFDAWDRGREIHIIGLARLDPEVFARLVEMLSETESPRWPVWHRGPYKDPEAAKAKGPADRAANALLDQTKELNLVVAISLGTPLDKILAARKIAPGMALPDNNDGWFSFLGYFL